MTTSIKANKKNINMYGMSELNKENKKFKYKQKYK